MAKDRQQQVKTIREVYGLDHFAKVGAMSSTFKDKRIAKRASWKYWHPERFDDDGKLLPEWQKVLDESYAPNGGQEVVNNN